jgi:hypothetical protein
VTISDITALLHGFENPRWHINAVRGRLHHQSLWKLDRLGRDLKHLVNTVRGLSDRNIGLCVLTGQGANIDTTTASGKLIFGIFAALGYSKEI